MANYRKLVSLNPEKYETISTTKAVNKYAEYIKDFASKHDLALSKSFYIWLKTEI